MDGTPWALLERLAQRATLHRQSLARLLRDRRLQGFDAIGVFLTGSKLNDIRLALQRNPAPCCSVVSTVWCWTTSLKAELEAGLRPDLPQRPARSGRPGAAGGGTPFAQQRTVLTGLRRNAPSPDLALCPSGHTTGVCRAGDHAGIDHRASQARAAAQRFGPSSPNWEVLIKPRIAPGDATFHDVDTHISTTLKQTLGVLRPTWAGLPPYRCC